MIDYKGIIEQLDTEKIKDLLDQMDIPYQEKESYLVMPTVCHNEDIDKASWKLYYYKNNHIFYCYTNCQSMSIFKFLKNYYETRTRQNQLGSDKKRRRIHRFGGVFPISLSKQSLRFSMDSGT